MGEPNHHRYSSLNRLPEIGSFARFSEIFLAENSLASDTKLSDPRYGFDKNAPDLETPL